MRLWTAPGYEPPSFFRGTAGHGDGASWGFAEPGEVLAIILLSDGDDCSARDPDLFDPASPVYDPSVHLRCFLHADALHDVERYADGLLQLRRDPRRLVFAAVVGIPPDLVPPSGTSPTVWSDIFEDERMMARIDPSEPSELVPSCNVPGIGKAYPPIRALQLARSLESRGARIALASICGPSFSGVLAAIIEAL